MARLEPEIIEARMVVRANAGRPVEQALGLGDGEVVDAGVAGGHQAVGIELPVFIAVGAKPLAIGVVRFVGETDGDTVFAEGPQLFDESIVGFALPLAGKEVDDLFAALQELVAVAPAAVNGIRERDLPEDRDRSTRLPPCALSRWRTHA